MIRSHFYDKKSPVDDNSQQSKLPERLARRLVNLASPTAESRVLCVGSRATAIATAVKAAGACIQGTKFPGDVSDRTDLPFQRKVDTVFWNTAVSASEDPLPLIRQSLRIGGRLVAWGILENGGDVSSAINRFQERLQRVGFTSIIVGTMVPDFGRFIAATGIFRPTEANDQPVTKR